MKITLTEFNIKQIADSGQCFRMYEIAPNHYGIPSADRYVEVIQHSERVIEFLCNEDEFYQYWIRYFDLETDYTSIIDSIKSGNDSFLKNAVSYGHGIRILHQDPFETMVSFILSQNKNIPAIRQSVDGLCQMFGHQIATDSLGLPIYSFPTPDKLAGTDLALLRQLKAGYRDQYIVNAANAVMDGLLNLNELSHMPADAAKKELLKINGIGEKVANCILLFGLHHIDVYPIDVWIKKMIEEIYHGDFNPSKYAGYAGIVQQYQFYYMRNGYKKRVP